MVAGFFEDFCGSITESIPDVIVERAQLDAVLVDETGEILTVVRGSFFGLSRMLFVTSCCNDGLLVLAET